MLSKWQCRTSSASSERPSAALADNAWISAARQTGSDAICGYAQQCQAVQTRFMFRFQV